MHILTIIVLVYMSISFFKVLPINPLTPSFPPYFEAVIKTARLTANVILSNLFRPLSLPSRMDADSGTGRIVAMARGATYNAISPRRFGDSRRIDQPQRRQPSKGPEVSSQYVRDLEGKRVGPRRERVRQTPYLLLVLRWRKYHVRETNVARNDEDRRAEINAYRTARGDAPLNSNKVLIGR
jgi:hypothetical protein